MNRIKTNQSCGTSACTFETLEGIATLKYEVTLSVRQFTSMRTIQKTFKVGDTAQQMSGGVALFTDGERVGYILNQSRSSISEIIVNC